MFTPPASDWTVQFLNHVFGVNWQTMYLGANPTGAATVLASIMGSFNQVAFIVMATFFSYTAIVSAYSTAHEGVALGRRYHWAYTPIRGMIGFGLLAPIGPNGLCLLQGLVLLFVYSGIGLADNLWSTTLSWMQTNGGSISAMSYEDPTSVSQSILKSLVAREYMVNEMGLQAGPVQFSPSICPPQFSACAYYADAQGYIASYPIATSSGAGAGMGPYSLGFVQVSCPAAVAPSPAGTTQNETFTSAGYSAYCNAKLGATQALINALQPVAAAIANAEGPTSSGPTMTQAQMSTAINNAIAQYQASIGQAVQTFSSSFNGPLSQDYASFVSNASAEGWASAGAWYLQIARVNDEVAKSMGATPTGSGPDASQMSGATYTDLQPLLTAADAAFENAEGGGGYIDDSVSNTSEAERSWLIRKVEGIFNSMKQSIMDGTTYITTSMANTSDPISTLQGGGTALLMIANGGVIADLTGSVLLNKLTGELVFKTVLSGIKMLYVPGFLMAYVVPLMPFVIWTMAVVAWVILVVESWIAAPIWAIAHGMPEGEGFVGQHARQGYMLFFSVLFKPALLMVGYFASILLISVILPFVAKGFTVFMHAFAAGQDLITVLIGAFVYFTAFVAICIMVMKKCFHLITWVPDNILRWVGNNVQPLLSGAESAGGTSGAPIVAIGGVASRGAGNVSKVVRAGLGDSLESGDAPEDGSKGALPPPGGGGGPAPRAETPSAHADGGGLPAEGITDPPWANVPPVSEEEAKQNIREMQDKSASRPSE